MDLDIIKQKGDFAILNIKAISDLRNYTAVLDTVAVGAPVYYI